MSAAEARNRAGAKKAGMVLVIMALLVVPSVLSLRQIHVENEVKNWLPSNDPSAETLQWYLDHFPREERVLLSWDGSSIDDPRVATLVRKLTGAADEAGGPRNALKYIRDVVTPQNLLDRMTRRHVEPPEALRRLEGVLVGTGPDAPIALSFELAEAAKETEKLAAIRAIHQAAEQSGIEEGALHLGGPSLVGLALNRGVADAVWNPKVPAFAIHKRSVLLSSALAGVLLAIIMLRSLRLATMVLFVAFYTTLLAVALVPISGGSMNMVLVVMPPLLIVLTISAAIHVVNYWKHAVNQDKSTATVQAIKMARLPCALASITTAVGLLSLTVSSLTPVRDFGLYSAVGCVLGLLSALFGLPALLQLLPPKSVRKANANMPAWQGLGRFVSRHWRLVTTAWLVVFCMGIFGLRWFRTDIRVIRNFPDDARIVQDFRFFEEQVGGVVPVEMIVRFDQQAREQLNFLARMEVVRDLETEMRRHPEISGTLSLADFWPVYEPPPADAGLLRNIMAASKANLTERRIKRDSGSAAKQFLVMEDDEPDSKNNNELGSNTAGDELWRITAQVGLVSDVDYAVLIRDLHQIAGSVLRHHPGTGHVVTGIVPVFERAQQAILESLIRSFGLAFVVIALVMMLVLKNVRAGAMTMLPNLLPIGIVFGAVSWSGLRIDVGTMITAAIALGIAVDGTLHLLAWFRDGVAQGLTRQEAVVRALCHCGPAMWQTSVVVVVGMWMLSFSDLLLISRFGWLMAALIAMALLADIVFLPALLAGPLGRMMQKGLLNQASRPSDKIAVQTNLTGRAPSG